MKNFWTLFIFIIFPFSLFSQDFFMPIHDVGDGAPDPVSYTTCTGNFFDSGGPGPASDPDAKYENNQNSIVTFYPDISIDPDSKIKMDFSVFATEAADILSVYDGADDTAPLIGTYSGGLITLPFTVQATNAAGCLTFTFTSNITTPWIGWEAEISCSCSAEAVLVSTVPTVDGDGVINIDPDGTVTVTGSHTFGDPDADVQYTWNFGDGTIMVGSDATVSHTYSGSGTFFITLIVTNLNTGCSSENIIGSHVLGLEVNAYLTIACEAEVDAGLDVTLTCDEPCVNLVADIDFAHLGASDEAGTASYFITQDYCIPEAVPATATGIESDDDWTGVVEIGFSFSFFGNTYTQLLIGDNGIVTFDLTDEGGFCMWPLDDDEPIPTTNYQTNAIFGAYHDLYTPAAPIPGDVISYYVSGIAPFRKFVVDYSHVPHFSCTTIQTSQQIILYETSNIIVVNIAEKPLCTSWQEGVAIIGIQNNSGTIAYSPEPPEFLESRNWIIPSWDVPSTESETWQFIPEGISSASFSFEWLDEDGNVLGTDPAGIEICGVMEETIITASADCIDCGFDTDPIFDTVTIFPSESFTATIDESISVCNGDIDLPVTVNTTVSGADDITLTYSWVEVSDPDGVLGTDSSFSVDVSGTYEVTITGSDGCVVILEFILEIIPLPEFVAPDDLSFCDMDAIPDDGFVNIFDLASQTSTIVDGATDLTVTYYEVEADAEVGVAGTEINAGVPYTNTTPFDQTIYFRVQADDSDCYVVESFQLHVFTHPTAISPGLQTYCDSTSASSGGNVTDGVVNNLDFTALDAIVTGGLLGLTVSYHLSLADADSGVSPIIFPYENAMSPFTQTIFVRVFSSIDCYDTTSFDIVINPAPVIAETPPDLYLCDNYDDDDNTNGIVQTFDFTGQTPIIQGAQTGVSISFYRYISGAETGDVASQIVGLYENETAFIQPIYFRIEFDDTGCYNTGSFQIRVTETVLYTQPEDLHLCDTDFDGIANFDIASQTATLDVDTGLILVSYHLTESDMEANINPIVEPDLSDFINTVNPQTIYVRIEDPNQDCVAYDNFTLNVHLGPLMIGTNGDPNTISAFEQCDVYDDDGFDGMSSFDLTYMNEEILDGQTGVSVFYYDTAAAADDDDPYAADSTALTSPYIGGDSGSPHTQPIWVVLVDNTTHCHSMVGSFSLIVHDDLVPDEGTVVTPLYVCDPDSDGFEVFDLSLADAQIMGIYSDPDNPVTGIAYYETMDDAELGITVIEDEDVTEVGLQYANINAWNQVVFARVENESGCFDVVSLHLHVHPTPQINFTPDDLEVCDDDGFTVVDLTVMEGHILGDDVSSEDVEVTYYNNENDAIAGEPAILNPTTYGVSPPSPPATVNTIWVRVEYTTDDNTDCASIVSFDIIVNFYPLIVVPSSLELCDNADDGEDNNGFVQSFWLTDRDAEILDGQAATVSYYFAEEAAQTGVGAINLAVPFENTIPGAQTLWVRVAFDDTGCFALTTLDVIVNPLPSPVAPVAVESCDGEADGYADFALDESLITEIQNGEAGVTITFHETLEDAQNLENILVSPYTSVVPGTQTIYARDTYDDTGCYSIVAVQLIANPAPQPNIDVTDYEVCDDDAGVDGYDGIAQFDLSSKDEEILDGIDPSTVTITYHLTEANALIGATPIDTSELYTNTTPYTQTIWARVADIETECGNIVSFQLIVNPLPVLITPSTYQLCDDDYDQVVGFDLESRITEILTDVVGTAWNVYFFETEALAEEGDLSTRLLSPYYNTTNPQTIWVRVESGDTGCFALTTLDLKVLPIPTVNMYPDMLSECDDSSGDGIEEFDLTDAITDIIGDFSTYDIAFYESVEDAEAETDPIPVASYETYLIDHPLLDHVWAVVTDPYSELLCSVIVKVKLVVFPLPDIVTPSSVQLCEPDDSDSDYFDLAAEINPFILEGTTTSASAVTITYFHNEADANADSNPLVPIDNYLLTEGDIVWARIVDNTTGCFSIAGAINITIDTEPIAVMPENDYEICDGDTDDIDDNGTEAFDLTSQSTTIEDGITGVLTTYYLTEDAAITEDATFLLVSPYTNASNPQTVWARVENASGCGNIVSFDIVVKDPPHFTLTDQTLCLDETGVGSIEISPEIEDDTITYDYEWSDGLGSGTVAAGEAVLANITAAGTYYLTLTNPDNCSKTDTIAISASQISLLSLEDLTIVDFAGNNTLTIPVDPDGVLYGIGDYVYSLDGAPFTTTVHYENLLGGEHTLIIHDKNECEPDTEIVFTIADYMRFFTPNDDGYNDFWQLQGVAAHPGAKIHVFDRFGKLLAKIDPNSEGWDGKFNGHQLPSTDYWYTIELEDGRIKKGHFSLVRR